MIISPPGAFYSTPLLPPSTITHKTIPYQQFKFQNGWSALPQRTLNRTGLYVGTGFEGLKNAYFCILLNKKSRKLLQFPVLFFLGFLSNIHDSQESKERDRLCYFLTSLYHFHPLQGTYTLAGRLLLSADLFTY